MWFLAKPHLGVRFEAIVLDCCSSATVGKDGVLVFLNGFRSAQFLKRCEMQQDGERDEEDGNHDQRVKTDEFVGSVQGEDVNGDWGAKYAGYYGGDEVQQAEEVPGEDQTIGLSALAEICDGNEGSSQTYKDIANSSGQGELRGQSVHSVEDEKNCAFNPEELQPDEPLLRDGCDRSSERGPEAEEQNGSEDGTEKTVLNGGDIACRAMVEALSRG